MYMHKVKLVFVTGVLLSSVGCIPQPLNDEKAPDSTKSPETVKEPVHQEENKEDTAHVTDVAEQPAIFGVESIDVYPSYVNLDGMGIYSSVYFFFMKIQNGNCNCMQKTICIRMESGC